MGVYRHGQLVTLTGKCQLILLQILKHFSFRPTRSGTAITNYLFWPYITKDTEMGANWVRSNSQSKVLLSHRFFIYTGKF